MLRRVTIVQVYVPVPVHGVERLADPVEDRGEQLPGVWFGDHARDLNGVFH